MAKRKLIKPGVATMPIWKAILVGGFVSIGIYFSAWVLRTGLLGVNNYSLEAICLASGGFFISILNWWVWQPKHKYITRWYMAAIGNLYGGLLFLFLSISGIKKSLVIPWNWYANGVLISLYIFTWILPLFSHKTANNIARKQDLLGLYMLKYGSVGSWFFVAGIIGKNWSSSIVQNQDKIGALVSLSFLSSLVAVFMAQYSSVYLWNCRPWNKENTK